MALVKSPVGALLAGEGGQIGRMRELVGELGLQSRVRLLGTAGWDEMRALYARALAVQKKVTARLVSNPVEKEREDRATVEA